MIHPASDKILALPIVMHAAGVQGSLVKFGDNGDGRLRADIVTTTTDISDFGAFLAYYITPDSEDVEFTGAPESATFNLNTDTGVGGGTNIIPSGSEAVALGGSKVALIRMDKNALYNTPSTLTSYVPGTILKAHSDGLMCLDSEDDLDVKTAKVVQNDGVTIVVLLA